MTENLPTEHAPHGEIPLESWKEIAAYLKRDISTLKRWEKSEGLPVHRHLHLSRSSVFAYPNELDDWWGRRRPPEDAPTQTSWFQRRPVRALAFTALLLLALVTAGDGLALRPASAAQREGTISRLVWAGPPVDPLGAPAPDGSYVAITDWETGNLAVRDTATGAMRRLTDNGDWHGWAEYPVPSPDGKYIAYAWFNEKAQRDLRVYSLETSSARTVYARDEVEYPQPFAWTPDGTHLLTVLTRTDRTNQIALISVEDGSARVLKAMDWRSPQELAISPDGRYVAYDFPRTGNSPERDVFLLAADGSRDEVLVAHPDNDVVLGWTPDGSRLLFASDRTGRLGIWALSMADGKALGSPVLVRSDVPLFRPMGLTRQGAFYYCVRAGFSDVYVAALDAVTGAVLSPPAPLSPRFVGWNRSPDWSADGRSVAYASQRESSPRSVGWMGGTIVVRSLASGEEREIAPRLEYWGLLVRWSPDGRSFLVVGRDTKGQSGIFTLSAKTGEATLAVRQDPPGYVQFPGWSSNGKSLFYLRTTPEASNRLHIRNLATGEDRVVFAQSTNNAALSPDGRSMVVRLHQPGDRTSVLAIVPVGGGEAKELLRVMQPNAFPPWGGLAWTPDGKYILFTQTTGDSAQQPFELWRVPVGGGTPQKTGIAMQGLRHLRIHPDDERIIFGAGQIKDETWVLENFLPTTAEDE
jgi:Tol biopolymer transport system component